MYISVFDIFSIGIGPSSSHTIGPMRAAHRFLTELTNLTQVASIQIELYGSLALTGHGHGTPKALLMGLRGEKPETVHPEHIQSQLTKIYQDHKIDLLSQHWIDFNPEQQLLFNTKTLLPAFSNGMCFRAYDTHQQLISEQIYYSVGGGFIVREDEINQPPEDQAPVPYPFDHADELLALCRTNNCRIQDIIMANERVFRDENSIREQLLHIANVMHECIMAGCHHEGILEGGLKVRRRAPALYRSLQQKTVRRGEDLMNWLNMFAMAVNEENAAGGRVVTAPTNGAAGIIPAVLEYYRRFVPDATDEGICEFLLTAGAIGMLYKKNAAISGAEMGCQGEVGVACSMAAGALTAVLGGSVNQVENAAEIGMEHNLGLTCDPVKGLVQIPCIERNAMGAVKALNATQLALAEDGTHKVSLDMVINTMREIGENMNSIYKETSQGGLAVNVVEC